MSYERSPMPSPRILESLVSYGVKVPESAERLAPHVIIRSIRGGLRMTQAQLARRAGMPQSHLAKIETGKVDVQLSTLRRILQAMFCETVLVPKFRKTPKEAIAERILEVARRKVAGAAGTGKTIQELIRAEEERLLSLPPSKIWEEPLAREKMPLRIVDKDDDRDTLRFWLAKSPGERIDAVEFLREQYYALSGHKTLPRLAHAVQVMDRPA